MLNHKTNMCLITFAYQQHPNYPFILVANRDEFYARPTSAMHYWEDSPEILAGRDLQQMGTWLGINKAGRFAAVTNVRDGRFTGDNLRSRGELTREYLSSPQSASDYLDALESHKETFGLFNLLIADNTGLYYSSNRAADPKKLTPGIYGLSNAQLDTEWPKVVAAKAALTQAIQHTTLSSEDLRHVLHDSRVAPDEQLPDTGIAYEWEKLLSSAFIHSTNYGTRATTVLLQQRDGTTTLHEMSFDAQGNSDQCTFTLKVDPIR